ncbi:MAG: beta-aspartyl-peptidase [Flavobacteriaceae bacterium TMED179]|nr:MAG: beta-aspartyl-peptidase [Flavobacteriaceae bacterium TMED179]|tara:strand:+ start:11901 stop:12926 length:1026 start_codon:yes stop_codon:yes gene_type:complete
MNKLIFLTLFIFLGCRETPKTKVETSTMGIVIHGGAGTILKKNMTLEKEQEYRAVLTKAIMVGYNILKSGGTSQEAVEKTIHVMEDSPLFNAGKGAVLNSNASIELDASFMDGESLDAGAISGVRTIKNPISAAIKVMEASPHVMLSGLGAETFANENGLEIVTPEYFFTERRINSLKRVQEAAALKETTMLTEEIKFLHLQRYGTVGCAALDLSGNLAAGTSTGGMTNKKWNRIGDAPIIGAGTYANNATCAISATGWGEFFIRSVVAHDISALMEYKGFSIQEAAHEVIHNKVAKLGGDGGVVGIDFNGNIMMEMNTPGMYRAQIDASGKLQVKIYKDE